RPSSLLVPLSSPTRRSSDLLVPPFIADSIDSPCLRKRSSGGTASVPSRSLSTNPARAAALSGGRSVSMAANLHRDDPILQGPAVDRKSTRLNSSHQIISYAV